VHQGKATLSIYLAHRRALVNYASGIIGSRTHAEDVVQEAYIRFSAAGKEGRRGASIERPVNYLYRIVRNLALDWTRRASRETLASTDTGEIAVTASDAPSTEEILLYRDELRIVAEALLELPERTRLAFNMVRLEGRSLQEAADRLGVSAVRVHQLVKEAVLHGARKLDEGEG
jgi:RNA polymerase sigma-70 factor (ECF subfamily)